MDTGSEGSSSPRHMLDDADRRWGIRIHDDMFMLQDVLDLVVNSRIFGVSYTKNTLFIHTCWEI